jgi:tetratricopeptide (TPR) repeat protein
MTALNVGAESVANPRRRLLAYPICIASILLFRVVVPPLVLLTWPAGRTVGSGLWDAQCWSLILMAVAADAGQSFGGSRFFARHAKAVLGGLGAAAILVIAVFWRPIVAEYSYMRWMGLMCLRGPDSEREGASAALTRAYRLRPDNEKYAHAYAQEVLLGPALDLMLQEDYDEALKALEKIPQSFQKFPFPHRMLGVVHARQGNAGKAVAAYRKAIAASRRLTAEDYRTWATLFGFPTSACEMHLLDSLGEVGGDESAQEILTFLAHEDDDVVVHAVGVLAEHGITRAIGPLRQLEQSHKERKVRQAARRALLRLE